MWAGGGRERKLDKVKKKIMKKKPEHSTEDYPSDFQRFPSVPSGTAVLFCSVLNGNTLRWVQYGKSVSRKRTVSLSKELSRVQPVTP